MSPFDVPIFSAKSDQCHTPGQTAPLGQSRDSTQQASRSQLRMKNSRQHYALELKCIGKRWEQNKFINLFLF